MVVFKLYIQDLRYQRRILVYAINIKEPASQPNSSGHAEDGNVSAPSSKGKNSMKKCLNITLKILYVVISVINILLSIILMGLTVSTAISLKIFSPEQSGRLVALIVLTIIAAVTLSVTIYSVVAVLRNQKKPVHAASIAFIVIAIIQAIIIGSTMRLTVDDELKLIESLNQSFQFAREDITLYVKQWSTIQYDLSCCGVVGPNDYYNSNLDFIPNIPISCCPSYDPSRSDLVQEKERLACRVRKEYYDEGCANPILDLFKFTTDRVVGLSVTLIVFVVGLAILGLIWIRIHKQKHEKREVAPSNNIPIENLSKA